MKKRSVKKPKIKPLQPVMAESTSFLLAEAGEHSRELFAYYLSTLNIKLNHFAILFRLFGQGPLSQVELGQQLEIDRAPMVHHIDYLEQRGLVKRTPNLQDRRAYEILLTDEGEETLVKALELARRVEVELLASLSAQEQVQLNHLMNRLLASHFMSDATL